MYSTSSEWSLSVRLQWLPSALSATPKQTIHLHLVPSLRNSGAKPSLPHVPSWRVTPTDNIIMGFFYEIRFSEPVGVSSEFRTRTDHLTCETLQQTVLFYVCTF
jgi:hypothetical protein